MKTTRILAFLFFMSGLCSLIYEVVWQRILTIYLGVEHVSTTLVVAIFLAGLGLGSFFGGRIIDGLREKVVAYAIVEFIIGIMGILSIVLFEAVGSINSYAARIAVLVSYLLLPTMLMGSTLPIILSIFSSGDLRQNISLLYFLNTIGAAFGALLAAFVLVSFFGMVGAIVFAFVINIIIALSLLYLRKRIKYHDFRLNRRIRLDFAGIILFITGFTAMAYQVVWFRILSVLTKSSPYSVATVLFTYLVGISLGSYYVRKKKYSMDVVFMLQVMIALYSMLALISVSAESTPLKFFIEASNQFNPHPYLSIEPYKHMGSEFTSWLLVLYQNTDLFFWSVFFMLVPTFLMGATFPLVTSSAIRKLGKDMGSLQFFSVFGNVAGVLVSGFIFLPVLKTVNTLVLLAMIGLAFSIFMKSWKFRLVALASLLLLFILPSNSGFYTRLHGFDEAYVVEGMDSVVVTHENDQFLLYINGLRQGTRPGDRLYYETIEQMSYLNKEKPRILIIGLGTASGLEAVLKMDIESVTVVELRPSLYENLAHYPNLKSILSDPRVNLVFADGRIFLQNHQEKYDAVLMDPLRMSTSNSNNICSLEFFRLVRDNLEDDGIFGLYNDRDYCLLHQTLAKEFRYFNIYTYFTVASPKELKWDERKYEHLLDSFDEESRQLIKQIQSDTVLLANQDDIGDGSVLTDFSPWLEYRIGRALHDRSCILQGSQAGK